MQISRAKWVKVYGTLYKKDAGVVYSISNDHPQVGQILNIYIVNGTQVVFKALKHTTTYVTHYHCYHLHPLPSELYIDHNFLVIHTPIHIRSPRALRGVKVVVMPHCLYY